MWWVDPRAFPEHPFADEPVDVSPPTDAGAEARAWWDDLRRGASTNFATLNHVFRRPAGQLVAGPQPEAFQATGQAPLWSLAPGEIRPVLVAVTQRGAIAFWQGNADLGADPQLTGVRVPPWLAFATDLMGTVAGVAATQEHLEGIVPEGRFLPLPEFTAEITADEEGVLDYLYGLRVAWSEGLANEGGGLLGLAPSTLGLSFAGTVEFGLRGQAHEVFLEAKANTETADLGARLLPPVAGVAVAAARLRADAQTLSSLQFAPVENPYQFEQTQQVGGSLDAHFEADLKGPLGRTRFIGRVLKLLNPAEVTGLLDAGIELNARTVWRTPFPPARPVGSGDPELDHVFRRHFLGGSEERSDAFDLCFRFGAGLRLTDPFERVGATGWMRLTGGNTCASGQESLIFTVNPHSDWPRLKRVQGQARLVLESFLDVWVTRFEKRWEWPLVTIERQYGTVPYFEITPLLVSQSRSSPADASGATFHPDGGARLSDLFGPARFALDGADGNALLWADVEPDGSMSLKLATRAAEAGWGTPQTLATAGGILALDMTRLASGQRLVVWTQIAAADVDNPFPPSQIMYALGDPTGESWSSPQLVATLPDVASELHLVAGGPFTGLVFLHTDAGPTAAKHSLAATTFDGSTWSAPADWLSELAIQGLATAANPSDADSQALVAVLDDTGRLVSYSWDGAAPAGPFEVAARAGLAFAVQADDTGRFHCAWETAGGDLVLSRFDGSGQWTALGTLGHGLQPSSLVLLAASAKQPPGWYVAWIAGGDGSAVRYLSADDAGQVIAGPTELTGDFTGPLSHLALARNPSGEPMAWVREEGTSAQLFEVPLAEVLAVLTQPRFVPGVGFEFLFTGRPGQPYRIQASTNLINWQNVANLIGTPSPFQYRDPDSRLHPQRFYRVVSP